MMLLAIDVGNTETVAAVWDRERLIQDWRLATERDVTGDELASRHEGILRLRGASLTDLDEMVVASVVPTVTPSYTSLAKNYLGSDAFVVGPGVRTGISLAIDNPSELGADRLANAVAARDRYEGPSIVVDFGTATTFDAVSAHGEYLGGAIAPGIETSLLALSQRAARLLTVDLVAPARAIGKRTAESMRSGAVFGTVDMVDGVIARFRDELEGEAAVLATGGLAGVVAELSDEIDEYDRLLTLDGLRLVHELNRGGAAGS